MLLQSVLALLMATVPAAMSACTVYQGTKELRVKDIEGMWYGQYTLKRMKSDYVKCERIHFYVHDDGKSIEMTESTLLLGGNTSVGKSFYGTGKQSGTNAKLTLTGNLDGTIFNYQYWILATDNKNYMIASLCLKGVEGAWILTRKLEPTSDTLKAIQEALKSINVDFNKFDSTPQKKCVV